MHNTWLMYIVHVECTLVNDVAGTGRAGQVLPAAGTSGSPATQLFPLDIIPTPPNTLKLQFPRIYN